MTGQPNPGAPRRKRRWPRRVLVVFLVLGCVYAAYRYALHRMVEAKLDEIRKQAYPVTLAELDKWYPQVPAGENAADVYLEAFKHFAPKEAGDTNLPVVGDAKLPRRGQPMSDETKRLVAEHLEKNQEALALLHRGAKLVRCRYPVDLTQGGAVLLPHLTKIRVGVRLLCLEAILHAERGEATQAAQSIACSLALARSLSAEPIEISQLVRLACYTIAATHLEAVLNWVRLPDASLAELTTRFSELDAKNSLVRGYAGQRCLDIAFYKRPIESTLTMLENKPLPPGLKRRVLFVSISGRLDIFLLRHLEATGRFLQVCQAPFPEGVKHIKDADPPLPFGAFFVGGTWRLGTDRSVVQLAALRTAHVTTSLASLAVERYRLAKGSLPDNLDGLVPAYLAAVPADPFTSQPLRYKKLAKGYVVYSVGEDGKDDGGDEKKDITFTVER